MITTAPLPGAGSLIAWAKGRNGDATAPWRRPGDCALTLSRTCWSLALLAGLRGPAPRVAVPAWFCAASLAPLRALGAELDFVAVDSRGLPQWDRVSRADLVVAVHTFGRPVPLDDARAACRRTGAWLVEDAAHAVGPAAGIGEQGDFVLYSPHKVLALPDGAVLVSRQGILPAPPDQPAAPVGPWLRRRLVQRLLPDIVRPWMPQGGQPHFADDPAAATPPPCRRLSTLGARLMAGADLKAEAARRRANADSLRRTLGDLPGWAPLFPDDGPAPYRFALRCDDPTIAAQRYRALRQARLPVESWPDLPPEVTEGAAVDLRRSVIVLPVHGALPAGYARTYRRVFVHD